MTPCDCQRDEIGNCADDGGDLTVLQRVRQQRRAFAKHGNGDVVFRKADMTQRRQRQPAITFADDADGGALEVRQRGRRVGLQQQRHLRPRRASLHRRRRNQSRVPGQR